MVNSFISFIMSVYNHEKTLKKAIKSIINQSYKNFEFIIINDGSTDNSKHVINIFKKRNKNIRFYNFEENKGLAIRLNYGIKKSKGIFIARMDADDVSKKNRLLIQKKFLEKNTKFSLVGSNAVYLNKKEKILKKTNLPLNDKEIKNTLFIRNPIIHSSILVRKKFFLKNLYNSNFTKCQDYELWIRSSNKFKFYNLKDFLILRNESENFNLKNLIFSVYARIKNFKLSSIHIIFYGCFLDITVFLKLKLKKILL